MHEKRDFVGNIKNDNNVSWYNDYGARFETSMGDDLLKSILTYTQSLSKEAHQAAKDVQKQMLAMVESKTPIRQYSTHTQNVQRITVHRSKNVPKAVHCPKAAKYQPGVTKASWKYLTSSTLFRSSSDPQALLWSRVGSTLPTDKEPRIVYAVRNTTRWSIIHLINFDHDTVAHDNRYLNSSKGSGFVTSVQDWGIEELDKKLSKFLERK